MILSNFLATLCRETCLVVDLEIVQDPAKLSIGFYQKMQLEIERLENMSEQDRKQLYALCSRRQRGSMTRWDCYSENAVAAAHKETTMFIPIRRSSLYGISSQSSSSTTTTTSLQWEEQNHKQQQQTREQEKRQQQHDTLPRRPLRRASNNGCQSLDRQCSWASSA